MFNPRLSLALDRALVNAERHTGLKRLAWRLWLRVLEVRIPR